MWLHTCFIVVLLVVEILGGPAWAASYSTTFDDPAENPLSESGAWTDGPGNCASTQKSGGLAGANAVDSCAVVSSITPTDDQYAEVVFGLFESASQVGRIGPLVRGSTTAGTGYACVGDDNTPGFRFYKLTESGGDVVWTLMGSEVTSPAPNASSKVKITASGTGTVTLECFVNDSSIGTRTDSTSPWNSGRVGFAVEDPGFNGFKITSFNGGDSGGGGGPDVTPFYRRRAQ